jgi:hypothetical protein
MLSCPNQQGNTDRFLLALAVYKEHAFSINFPIAIYHWLHGKTLATSQNNLFSARSKEEATPEHKHPPLPRKKDKNTICC